MGTIDFESIYNDVKDAVVSIVVSAYKNYKNAAISDATSYLNKAKEKIKEYTLQLVNEEIYEEKISVRLMHFERPEQKFDSLEALQAQIERDTEHCRQFFHTEK